MVLFHCRSLHGCHFGNGDSFGVPMDIQFKGGSMITYSYTGELSSSAVEDVAQSVVGNVSVQESQDVSSGVNSVVITVAGSGSLTNEMHEQLTQAMEENFPENNIKIEETDNVDPTMGREFLPSAWWLLHWPPF